MAYSGSKTYWTRLRWSTNTGLRLYQTASSLIAGTYTLSADMNFYDTSNSNSAVLYAGATTKNATRRTSKNDSGWETVSLSFTNTETADVEIGFRLNHVAETELIAGVDNFVLTYTTNYTTALSNAIAYATQVNTSIDNSTLTTAIATAQAVLDDAPNAPAYQTTIDDAITTLNSAVSTALAAEMSSGDDVTYLLQNPSFEDGQTWYIKTSGGDSYYADNWVNSSAFESSSWSYSILSEDYKSAGSKSYKIRFNWGNATYNISQSIPVTLPSGRYTITADVRATNDNSSTNYAYVKGNNTQGSTVTVSTLEFSTVTADADLDAAGTLNVLLGMDYRFDTRSNTSASAQGIYYWDNVTLTYTSAAEAYAAAVTAATTTYNDATYANVTGSEKTALNTLITQDASSFTVAEYFAGVTAIETAVAAFTDAKQSYDEYYYENQTATRLGTDVSDVTTVTSAATAETAAHEINVINYTAVSGGSYTDVSETVLGSWTDTNVNSSQKGQHWDGTGSTTYFEQANGYSSSAPWSMSRTQTVRLAAGTYILQAAVRAKSTADATITVSYDETTLTTMGGHHGDSGLGITTGGVASYTSHDTDDTKVYANSNAGRGWEWKYVPFTLDSEADVTLTFSGSCTGVINAYMGFCNLAILTETLTAAKNELLTAINTASAITTAGTNVGSDVFQIPTSAKTTLEGAVSTAQGVYDDSNSTDEVTEATSTLNAAVTAYNNAELNAPSSSTRYKLTLANKGALTFRTASTEGGYGMPFMTAGDYMAQHFTFHAVDGETNTYTLSFEDLDGNTRYVCTRAQYGSGGTGTYGIRTFADGEEGKEALKIKIEVSGTDGIFYMLNTECENNKLGAQNSGDFYTVADNSNWSIAEASQASVTVSCKAGKYGTVIFPFVPSVTANENVKFYTFTGVENDYVQLEEATTLAANTPYIIKNEGSEPYEETLTGWGTAAADSYSTATDAPYLTGVYTAATIAASDDSDIRYVLQTQGEGENAVQAFYTVDNDFTATAYRCYLTVSNEGATGEGQVKAFYLDFGDADGIRSIDNKPLTMDSAEIFNLAGQLVQKAQKGIYIVNGKKVAVK